jgi:PAS domain-containing protein
MDTSPSATFQIDTECLILRASDPFCRMMRCVESGLIGRDVHDLIREDWRRNYRTVVERARHGRSEIAVPLIAPCGLEGWFTHTVEPLGQNGTVNGYRVTVVPRTSQEPLAQAS